MSLFCRICGSGSAWDSWRVAAAGRMWQLALRFLVVVSRGEDILDL